MAREMKDSGIEWIGEIPENWSVAMLKRIATIQTGSTPAKNEDGVFYSTETGIPWIKAENLGTNSSIEETSEYLTADGAKVGRIFEPNTVYVCCIASVGKVGFSTVKASCNQQINALCFKDFFWKYGYYMTCAQETEYILSASGNVMKILNSEKQSRIMCPIPSSFEQHRIADFLDRKCAEIDRVLEKTRASIEEYKKLKQSVITQAVTKGIRGKREMKDSGIEWIGEIPKEWDCLSLGQLTISMRNGYVGPTKDILVDDGVKYIQSIHIKNGDILFDKEHYYVSEEWANSHPKIHTGNVLIVQTGDIGQVGLVKVAFDNCNCHALIICDVNNEIVSSEFLTFYLRSIVGKEILLSHKTGALLPHLNSGKIKASKVLLPNASEQQEIVEYLDKQCSEIDILISKKEQLITELEAYKKSLIYEYVTGKKEVQ